MVKIELEIKTDNKELATICELYWQLDEKQKFPHKVSDLAEILQVDNHKFTEIIRNACEATFPTWNCPSCGTPYVFSSRSDFTGHLRDIHTPSQKLSWLTCSECREKEKALKARLMKQEQEAAAKAKEAADNQLRIKIREHYDLSVRSPIEIGDLSLTDLVYLYSLMLAGAQENLTKIIPPRMFEHPFAPTTDLAVSILKFLYRRDLIYVHPETEPDAFPHALEKGDLSTFYLFCASYAPPVSLTYPNNPAAIVQELLARINGDWPEEWYDEALELWNEIALAECTEYLLFSLNEHHFEFNPGEKTNQYLQSALQNYSTGQVVNIIWRAVRDAGAYYQRGNISSKHAANVAVSSIQRYTDRAVAEGWDLKPYRRSYNYPQTVLSEVFYNTTTKIGIEGFQLRLSKQALKDRRIVNK